MRVRVIGNSESAAAVRSSLNLAGVVVSNSGYGYTVEVNDETAFQIPTIDGVDSDFERRFINCICVAADTSVVLLRPGGIQSDRHIRIGVPQSNDAFLVEKGIMRAVVQMMIPGPSPKGKVEVIKETRSSTKATDEDTPDKGIMGALMQMLSARVQEAPDLQPTPPAPVPPAAPIVEPVAESIPKPEQPPPPPPPLPEPVEQEPLPTPDPPVEEACPLVEPVLRTPDVSRLVEREKTIWEMFKGAFK